MYIKFGGSNMNAASYRYLLSIFNKIFSLAIILILFVISIIVVMYTY